MCVTAVDGKGLAEKAMLEQKMFRVREGQSSLGSGHGKCKGRVAGLWLPRGRGPKEAHGRSGVAAGTVEK